MELGGQQRRHLAFAGIVACQIGTGIAARTEHASLRSVGLFTNPLLLAAIGAEVAFVTAVIFLPPIQALFGTAPLTPLDLAILLLLPFPILIWGADEFRRFILRRRSAGPSPLAMAAEAAPSKS